MSIGSHLRCRREEVFEGVDAGFDGFGVAAAHEDDDGDVVRFLVGEDALVTLVESVTGEGELAEGVFGQGIDAGLIKNEVEVLRADFFECAV